MWITVAASSSAASCRRTRCDAHGTVVRRMLRATMISKPESDKTRTVMRWILAAFYTAAGIAHLWAPERLLAITPSWVPLAPQVIFLTGVFEILGSVALVTR